METKRKITTFAEYGSILKELDLLTDEFRQFLKSVQKEIVTYPFSHTKIFGSIDKGSLVDKSIELAEIATELNETFYGGQANNKLLARASILAQLAKVHLYEPTTEDWEIKRGIFWKFATTEMYGGAKMCESSYLIARNLGITIDSDEYRAILANDKDLDDNKINLYGSLVEKIMRQANIILSTRNHANIDTVINNKKHFYNG